MFEVSFERSVSADSLDYASGRTFQWMPRYGYGIRENRTCSDFLQIPCIVVLYFINYKVFSSLWLRGFV
jgi:hypothetical protein